MATSVVTPERFAKGMTFDEYVTYTGSPQNLAREAFGGYYPDGGSFGAPRKDNSGVFRVTTDIARAQIGHAEGDDRFASDSLVMQAQRDGFRDDGPTIEQAVDDNVLEDEASQALRRERLATLAARARSRTQLDQIKNRIARSARSSVRW